MPAPPISPIRTNHFFRVVQRRCLYRVIVRRARTQAGSTPDHDRNRERERYEAENRPHHRHGEKQRKVVRAAHEVHAAAHSETHQPRGQARR